MLKKVSATLFANVGKVGRSIVSLSSGLGHRVLLLFSTLQKRRSLRSSRFRVGMSNTSKPKNHFKSNYYYNWRSLKYRA